jgi:hypothetical protein
MQNYVEWFGYAASVVVAVSLLMSSLIRLRWINMVGALMFTAYGLMIHAYPVALLNFTIAGINVYYLTRTYRRKDQFKVVPAGADGALLAEFLRDQEHGIRRYFPGFALAPETPEVAFFTLRNAHVAGVILSRRLTPDTLLLTLDYVTPEYRDFKMGRFVFEECAAVFRERGIARLASEPHSPEHRAYLQKMGFAAGRIGERDLLVRAVGGICR